MISGRREKRKKGKEEKLKNGRQKKAKTNQSNPVSTVNATRVTSAVHKNALKRVTEEDAASRNLFGVDTSKLNDTEAETLKSLMSKANANSGTKTTIGRAPTEKPQHVRRSTRKQDKGSESEMDSFQPSEEDSDDADDAVLDDPDDEVLDVPDNEVPSSEDERPINVNEMLSSETRNKNQVTIRNLVASGQTCSRRTEVPVASERTERLTSSEHRTSTGNLVDIDTPVVPTSRVGGQREATVGDDTDHRASTANNHNGDVDNSVILNVFRSQKAEVMDFIKESFKEMKRDIEKQVEGLNELKEEIIDLASIVVTAANAMVGKQGSNSVKPKEIQRALCIVPSIFTDKVICTVMAKVVIGFCENEITKEECAGPAKVGTNLFEILFFSKLRTEKKREKFCTQMGKKYSSFRHGILLSCVMAMQDNAFHTFLTEKERKAAKTISSDSKVLDRSALFASKVMRPPWIAPGYINLLHCENAAARAENRSGEDSFNDKPESESSFLQELSQVSNHSEDPSRKATSNRLKSQKSTCSMKDFIAVEAAGLVYKAITNVLHKSRDATKIQLFHEGLYVFTGWSQYHAKVEQSSLRLKWQQEQSQIFQSTKTFPVMSELHVLERFNYCRLKSDDVNEVNMCTLRTFMKEHPEMFLIVEHDVIVSGKVRSLRYYVNIIEVVAKLLASYTSTGTNGKTEDILNVHTDSLKVIVIMSIALRGIIQRTMEETNRDGTVMWLDLVTGAPKTPTSAPSSSSTSHYMLPKVNGVSLENLQPPRSKQNEIIGPLLLTLKEAEYNEKNRGFTLTSGATFDDFATEDPHRNGGDLPGDDNHAIEANNSLSVFRFT